MAIVGLTPRRSGSERWLGRDIAGQAAFRHVANGIGCGPEDRRIFSDLAVWENLGVARRPAPAGTAAWDQTRVFELFPDLRNCASARAACSAAGSSRC